MRGCTVLALIKFSDVNFAAWNQSSLCKLHCGTVILIQLRSRQSFLNVCLCHYDLTSGNRYFT